MILNKVMSIFGGRRPKGEAAGMVIEALPDKKRSGIISVQEAIAAKPSWVKYQVDASEASALAAEIKACRAESALEVGVASGFSSAVLYSALAQNTDNPKLYSMDWSKPCYFDKARNTGDALYEIHGNDVGYSLTTGIHTGMVKEAPVADFCFIDANHQNPWPALDLMSLGRFVRPGGIIALHDFEMIYHSWGRHASGARDLFRGWQGEKWRREGSSNVGFLRYDPQVLMRSLPAILTTDWDLAIKDNYLKTFKAIAGQYPAKHAQPITKAINQRKNSAESTKLLPAL